MRRPDPRGATAPPAPPPLRAGLLALAALAALAAPAAPGAPPLSAQGIEVTLNPAETIYPEYEADPLRPTISVSQVWTTSSELSDSYRVGPNRFRMAAGGRFPILRLSVPDRWTFDYAMDGGFFAQFDQRLFLDNIGWDGWLAAHLMLRTSPELAFRFSYRHLSSHLGDEFMIRTGRTRKDYTREDMTLGVGWTPAEGWTAYAEAGAAVQIKRDQKPGLGQVGLQWRVDPPGTGRGLGWLLATDIQVLAERDYEPQAAVQAALLLPSHREGQVVRLFAAWLGPHVLMGELGEFRERAIHAGVEWDF